MLLAAALAATVAPVPKSVSTGGARRYAAAPELACAAPDGAACPPGVGESFAFYARLMFQREQPYTAAEYAERLGAASDAVVGTVRVRLARPGGRADLLALDEAYNISVDGTAVVVDAANEFGAARAFQTLMQLVEPLGEDPRAYVLVAERVSDAPGRAWRHLGVDACSHYMPPADLRRLVDAASMLKLNVLLLDLVCPHSFPLLLSGPLSRLAGAAYSPRHFYDRTDIAALQAYARARGVVIVPQL